MRGRWHNLSRPRRFLTDMLHYASRIPTIPVQRHMAIPAVVVARDQLPRCPGWPAIFLKAYALVNQEMPCLRRAYLRLPWPHLCEYPDSVASIAVERSYEGEPCVFFGRISSPGNLPLTALQDRIRTFAQAPLDSIKPFRKMLAFARLPRLLRRILLGLGLNMSRTRPGQFGTFGLSVYSSLGAEPLHPLSPLTTTLTYGVIAATGQVTVRIVYDHRAIDGASAARALGRLETALNGPILNELHEMGRIKSKAA